MTDPTPEITAFHHRMVDVGAATLTGLHALEVSGRHLHPPVSLESSVAEISPPRRPPRFESNSCSA
ncbi:MAG: hypothetical protein GY937_29230 [bacterium]|nr:hypothetical protein [bacterium]